jgi:hypothetical protein
VGVAKKRFAKQNLCSEWSATMLPRSVEKFIIDLKILTVLIDALPLFRIQ